MKVEVMSAQILDGRTLAQQIKDRLKKEIVALREKFGCVPRLVTILLGDDPSACAYSNSQKKVAEYIGIEYEMVSMPATATQKELIDLIKKLNQDARVNGIMIHKPLPSQIDYSGVISYIDYAKDLEGINVVNLGKMMLGQTNIFPCTPAAVMEHIKSTGVSIRGKEAVVIGRSEIVGKPLSLLLLEQNATVTICHSATSKAGKLEEHVGRADILVAAVGKANMIKGDWVKEGAIVIDVGINSVGNKIIGDIEFERAKEKASFITPVPGGVGPVTVVMLMRNGVEAFKIQQNIKDPY